MFYYSYDLTLVWKHQWVSLCFKCLECKKKLFFFNIFLKHVVFFNKILIWLKRSHQELSKLIFFRYFATKVDFLRAFKYFLGVFTFFQVIGSKDDDRVEGCGATNRLTDWATSWPTTDWLISMVYQNFKQTVQAQPNFDFDFFFFCN